VRILAEPIDAIVIFKGKNKPRPFKFRYCDGDDVIHEIKIDKIIQEEETKIAGIKAFIYRCQSEIDGSIKVYELKYRVAECRWELYKM
jgi:hypothetical protein